MPFHTSDDPAFDRMILGNAPVKQLATGFDWLEGPVWFGDAGCLLFSDIPGDTIWRWTPGQGVTPYRPGSNFANGNTRDRQGRLVTCEHATRRVTRTELDGRITVIADRYDGKRLNSPNDVIVKSDGSIWFSDPHYGIMMDYEGEKAEQEVPNAVYRWTPETETLTRVITDRNGPNGLCFSPDESLLYVADTGRFGTDDVCGIHVYDMVDDLPVNGRPFHQIDAGCADGMRVDVDGNLWSSAADGVHCIAPDGRRLGRVHVPETVSNICFGGRNKHVLYITASTSIYSVALNTRGIQWP